MRPESRQHGLTRGSCLHSKNHTQCPREHLEAEALRCTAAATSGSIHHIHAAIVGTEQVCKNVRVGWHWGLRGGSARASASNRALVVVEVKCVTARSFQSLLPSICVLARQCQC